MVQQLLATSQKVRGGFPRIDVCVITTAVVYTSLDHGKRCTLVGIAQRAAGHPRPVTCGFNKKKTRWHVGGGGG